MIFRALLIKGWEARCGAAGGNLDSALPLGHPASHYKILKVLSAKRQYYKYSRDAVLVLKLLQVRDYTWLGSVVGRSQVLSARPQAAGWRSDCAVLHIVHCITRKP